MRGSDAPKIRAQISIIGGVWVVTIYNGEHTENRSFRNEIDARDYGKARLGQLRWDRSAIKIDPKIR